MKICSMSMQEKHLELIDWTLLNSTLSVFLNREIPKQNLPTLEIEDRSIGVWAISEAPSRTRVKDKEVKGFERVIADSSHDTLAIWIEMVEEGALEGVMATECWVLALEARKWVHPRAKSRPLEIRVYE